MLIKALLIPQENEDLFGPEVPYILCYFNSITNMGLFYPNYSKSYLMGYADAYYLSDPHNVIVVDHKQNICSHVVTQ